MAVAAIAIGVEALQIPVQQSLVETLRVLAQPTLWWCLLHRAYTTLSVGSNIDGGVCFASAIAYFVIC